MKKNLGDNGSIECIEIMDCYIIILGVLSLYVIVWCFIIMSGFRIFEVVRM